MFNISKTADTKGFNQQELFLRSRVLAHTINGNSKEIRKVARIPLWMLNSDSCGRLYERNRLANYDRSDVAWK